MYFPGIDEGSRRPCAFGDRMVQDCEVATTMPEKCVTMVCRDGTIVEEMLGGPMETGCELLIIRFQTARHTGFVSPNARHLYCNFTSMIYSLSPSGCLGIGNVLYSNGHQTEHCMPMTCKDSVWVPEETIPQCCKFLKLRKLSTDVM